MKSRIRFVFFVFAIGLLVTSLAIPAPARVRYHVGLLSVFEIIDQQDPENQCSPEKYRLGKVWLLTAEGAKRFTVENCGNNQEALWTIRLLYLKAWSTSAVDRYLSAVETLDGVDCQGDEILANIRAPFQQYNFRSACP